MPAVARRDPRTGLTGLQAPGTGTVGHATVLPTAGVTPLPFARCTPAEGACPRTMAGPVLVRGRVPSAGRTRNTTVGVRR